MFGRRPKNRRKRRENHLLEVKVHSEYQRQLRLRNLAATVTVLLVIGVAGFGMVQLSKYALRKFFHENPRFAIRTVSVQTDGHLSRDHILGLADIRPGANIFRVDLSRVKRDLELDPFIESAEVGRTLPDGIQIRVTERVPLARISVQPLGEPDRGRPAPVVFYVDRHGVVIPAFQLPPHRTLPSLTGVRLSDLRVGRPVQSPQVHAALELVRALELSHVGVRLDVSHIDLSRADALTVVTRQGETISFDPRRINQGLRRLGVILADAQRHQAALATVDLTVQQNVPVTFRTSP